MLSNRLRESIRNGEWDRPPTKIGYGIPLKNTQAVLAPPGTTVRLFDQPTAPPPCAAEPSVGPKRAADLPSLATPPSHQSAQL